MKTREQIKEIAEKEIEFIDLKNSTQIQLRSNIMIVLLFTVASVLFRFFVAEDQWFYHAFYLLSVCTIFIFFVISLQLRRNIKKKNLKAFIALKPDFLQSFVILTIILIGLGLQYFVIK